MVNLSDFDPLRFPRHFTGGGVYVKELMMPHKGMQVTQHKHNYDHLSLLAKGRVRVVTQADGDVYYDAPTAVVIKAGIEHHIEAMSDDVLWYCVHAIPAECVGGEDIEAALIVTEASK